MEKISDRIKRIRKAARLTQTAFGQRLGVSRSVIANVEGDVLARPDQKEPLYRLICKEFGVNEEWLRTGEGNIYEEIEEDLEKAILDIEETDPLARRAILTYWGLPDEDKEKFWEFIKKVINP